MHLITDGSVLQWLASATKQGNEKDRYSNSTKLASIWTERLTHAELLEIEEIAGDLMDFFGFARISESNPGVARNGKG